MPRKKNSGETFVPPRGFDLKLTEIIATIFDPRHFTENLRDRRRFIHKIQGYARQAGADFSKVWPAFAIYILEGSKYSALNTAKKTDYPKKREITEAICDVVRLYKKRRIVPESWSSAWDRPRGFQAAERAAAEMARAEVDAWAAKAAAEAAAEAAAPEGSEAVAGRPGGLSAAYSARNAADAAAEAAARAAWAAAAAASRMTGRPDPRAAAEAARMAAYQDYAKKLLELMRKAASPAGRKKSERELEGSWLLNPGKATKKKTRSKNPNDRSSEIIRKVAEWYKKNGYMTGEVEDALKRVTDPRAFLCLLYIKVSFDSDLFPHWRSSSPAYPSDASWDDFKKVTGLSRDDMQGLTDLSLKAWKDMGRSGRATGKTDQAFEKVAGTYKDVYRTIKDGSDRRLKSALNDIAALGNFNEAMSFSGYDTDNPKNIPETLDYIKKFVLSFRYAGLVGRSSVDRFANDFQTAIKEASSASRVSSRSKGRMLPDVRRNPSKKKAKKKRKVTKTAVRKVTPEWQRLTRRCQKLWDHYCERPGKTRLKDVFKHLEKMEGHASKKVKEERSRCMRAAKAEAKRLKMKV